MAQTNKFNIDANLQGSVFRAQANERLSALASCNAGNVAPASPVAGMLWLDTSNARKHYLKLRDYANANWGTICEIDPANGAIKAGLSQAEVMALISAKIDAQKLGAAGGVASLDASGKVPASQLPDSVKDVLEYSSYSNFPPSGQMGKIYLDKSSNKAYRYTGGGYAPLTPSKADLGLDRVDNVRDMDKPVSRATTLAIERARNEIQTILTQKATLADVQALLAGAVTEQGLPEQLVKLIQIRMWHAPVAGNGGSARDVRINFPTAFKVACLAMSIAPYTSLHTRGLDRGGFSVRAEKNSFYGNFDYWAVGI